MAGITDAYINQFVKPNYYLLQNVLHFLLPGRKDQFAFYQRRLDMQQGKRESTSARVRTLRLVELQEIYTELIVLTFLLTEELGTYFMAMCEHPGGDVVGSVVSKESYCFAHNFFQLSKRRSRDFFSRLMFYPNNPDLKALSTLPDDPDSRAVLNTACNLSCSYLWEKKERIRHFREQYKATFNSYKHGMSILYSMTSALKMRMKNGLEVAGSSDSPVVLRIKTDKARSAFKEEWQQLKGFDTIRTDVEETFGLTCSLFKDIVQSRVNFIEELLRAYKYDALTGTYVSIKDVKLSMRLFNLQKLSADDLKLLREKLGLDVD